MLGLPGTIRVSMPGPKGKDIAVDGSLPADKAGNTFSIVVSYNGVDQPIQVNAEQAIQAVLQHALQIFGMAGNPQNLILTLPSNPNVEIPPNSKVRDAGIQPGSRVLLRPRTASSG